MKSMHRFYLIACMAVVVVVCGGGSLSLTEYATEVEALVSTMTADFAALDSEWEAEPPTLGRAERYWSGRLEIREQFLEGVGDLQPPEAVEAQHANALDLFTRITAADVALAARVETLDEITSHWAWVDSPEGRASDAVLEEVYAFCRDSQAGYDATESRESSEDVAWIPQEMKEVVKVAFGCPP